MPTTTNSMGLKIPNAGETDYATSVSDSFNAIDTHTHASGEGEQIPTDGLEDEAVTTPKLADGALAASTAGRAKMADGFLSADAAGRAKMADGFLTRAKIAALGQQISNEATTGTFSTNAGTLTDITALTVTITTSGRPVFIGLINDNASANYRLQLTNIGGGAKTDVTGVVAILEGTTVISRHLIGTSVASTTSAIGMDIPASSIWTIRPVAAGTYTYKIQALSNGSSQFISFEGLKLVAYEIG
jgi:hypothetical protein